MKEGIAEIQLMIADRSNMNFRAAQGICQKRFKFILSAPVDIDQYVPYAVLRKQFFKNADWDIISHIKLRLPAVRAGGKGRLEENTCHNLKLPAADHDLCTRRRRCFQ